MSLYPPLPHILIKQFNLRTMHTNSTFDGSWLWRRATACLVEISRCHITITLVILAGGVRKEVAMIGAHEEV